MKCFIEIEPNSDFQHILHQEGCKLLSNLGELYFLGDFRSYELAYDKALNCGFLHSNGCFWCNYWHHTPCEKTEF